MLADNFKVEQSLFLGKDRCGQLPDLVPEDFPPPIARKRRPI